MITGAAFTLSSGRTGDSPRQLGMTLVEQLSPCLPYVAAAGLAGSTAAAVRQAFFAAIADPNLAEAAIGYSRLA
jgi:hypothetical protein